MILPDHHDIPADLYEKHHGEWTYQRDDEYANRCKICGAEVDGVGDKFGGMAYCTETGTMLMDW